MDGPRVGQFELTTRLAQGGMGDVWRGFHIHSKLPVAVKFIRRELIHDGRSRWDFEREMRWHARLEHPGIVYLFDHGELDVEAARMLGTHPGSPWMAMEFCSSPLEAIAGGLNWAGVRSLLLQLLDALAHAHSVGVLHRDIKIANVLVATEEDARPGVKLADFGIAHILGENDETTRSVGTPRYMAPEQVMGEWEDHGPWTDLYALGVLAWRLVTGRRPWARLRGSRLAMAMLHKPLGWPGPRFAVPPGVRDWIERLTAKSPVERYQLAADAREMLNALPEFDTEGVWMPAEIAGTLIPRDDEEIPVPREPIVRPMDDPPPESEANIRMHAAGLGLLPLRRPALIGRVQERSAVWKQLRAVARKGRPQLLSVVGPPRVGRTRFLEWLGETGERTGQGVNLKVTCLPGRDLGDQLAVALRKWFRIGARTLPEALDHLRSWLGDTPWLPDLTAMLIRGDVEDSSWRPVVANTIAALGRRRPVILRLEGTDRVAEIEGFVAELMRLEHAPVLIAVDRELPRALRIELGPMGDASMHRLADSLVSLDPDVRTKLVARAGGSPGFLVQVLTHWAGRDELEPGPRGFVVRGELGLPPSLAVVSGIRLHAVREALSEPSLRCVERAAVLGDTIDLGLWDAVCGPGQSAARSEAMAVLLRNGLAEPVPGGWRFTSVPFREAVISGSSHTLADHLRCAEVLAEREVPAEELALGRHRLAAGDVEGALEPLARGCERVADHEGGEAGLAALLDLQRGVERLDGPMRIRWQARFDQLQAQFLAEERRFDRAEGFAKEALRTAEFLSDSDLMARCWADLGAVAAGRMDLPAQEACYRTALALARDVSQERLARWWVALAKSHLARGQRESWSHCLEAAGRCVDGTGLSMHLVPLGAAAVAQVRGDHREALDLLDDAYVQASKAGSGRGRLSVLRSRAHTLLDAGELGAARAVFRQAVELAVSLRSKSAATVLANAISLELQLDDTREARDLFDRHRFLLPPGEDGAPELIGLHCAAMAVEASRENWRHVGYHLRRVETPHPWPWGSVRAGRRALDYCAIRAHDAGQFAIERACLALSQRYRSTG